jgi:hypothetical protein
MAAMMVIFRGVFLNYSEIHQLTGTCQVSTFTLHFFPLVLDVTHTCNYILTDIYCMKRIPMRTLATRRMYLFITLLDTLSLLSNKLKKLTFPQIYIYIFI